MVDINDDLAGARPPFRVIACLAVHGRAPLLRYTIQRLYQKNDCYKVICAGDLPEDRKLCEELGAVWVQVKNNPLGLKWNAAFQAAGKYNPDACLFVGSSDWVSDNWIHFMKPFLQDYDLVGAPGCHLLHIGDENYLCYWPGYINDRKGESIGSGRMLSRTLLDQMQWRPFSDALNASLDYSMIQSSTRRAARIHLVDSSQIKSVSLSTNIWGNKHQFSDHYFGKLPSEKVTNVDEWLTKNFPEAFLVRELLKGYATITS